MDLKYAQIKTPKPNFNKLIIKGKIEISILNDCESQYRTIFKSIIYLLYTYSIYSTI